VTRITLADCGDTLDDANFKTEIAQANINRLFTFENFLKIVIDNWTKANSTVGDLDNLQLTNYFDKIFENNINYLLESTKHSYEAMKYKDVLKFAYYGMINAKDDYVLFLEDDYTKINATLFTRFLKNFFIIMNPIAPHWTEYMYRTYLNPIFKANKLDKHILEHLAFTEMPNISKAVDVKLFRYNHYVKGLVKLIFEGLVGKKDKPNQYKATIYYAKEFTAGQKIAMNILKTSHWDDNNKITDDYKKRIMEEMKSADNNSRTQALMFAQHVAKEVANYGKESLDIELTFDEKDTITENIQLITTLTKVNSVNVILYDEKTKPKSVKYPPTPGNPVVIIE